MRFILFAATVKGIVIFFISFSEILLLVYRNTMDFCTFICILQHYCICVFFLKDFSGVFRIFKRKNYVIYKNCQFYFIPKCMLFISFGCLVALARTSSSMLNVSGESEHPCVIPDLRQKAFNFLPLNILLDKSLSCMAFIRLRCFPCRM